MSKPLPHTVLNALAGAKYPIGALRRLDPASEIPEVELDPRVTQGGTMRQRMTTQLKTDTRTDGKVTHKLLVFSARQSGTGRVVSMRPRRTFNVTAESVQEMLDGSQRTPDGVTPKVLRIVLPILKKYERNGNRKLREHDQFIVRQASLVTVG